MKKQATKIKICGLTKEKEADYLNQIHADFAGMVVFFPKSKRNISLDQAKKIKSALLPEIKTVAVTVSPTLAQISQIAEAGFDLIQIHDDPADLDIKTAKSICEYTSKFSLPILKAFNVSDIDSYNYWHSCPSVAGFVFDAAKPGSGKTFDWTLLKNLPRSKKLSCWPAGWHLKMFQMRSFFLHPDGVDVSSGVEFLEKTAPAKILIAYRPLPKRYNLQINLPQKHLSI